MSVESLKQRMLIRKAIVAIHPKLSKFSFALLKLLISDNITRSQLEQCNNTIDVVQMLSDRYGENGANYLIYNNLKLLKAEAALECFAGVSIPDVDVHQTPYDALLNDIVKVVLVVGEERIEKLISYLAKEYLDDPHPDHVKDWGVLGVFTQLIDRGLITPENGTALLIDSIQQVFGDRSLTESCREYVENDLLPFHHLG